MFGGQSVDASGRLTFLNDLWKWDGQFWTWLGGSNMPSASGVYGQKGVADPANMPGARVDGQCWGDNDGHFWVYGGLGYAGSGTYGELSDLWKFDHSNWIWMNGSSTLTSVSNYGQQGVTAASNTPGSRYDTVGWTDANANFWQFGGMHNNDEYNDLWKFDGTYWTWVAGANNPDGGANYGTPGFGAPQNTPGPRAVASGHIDRAGKLWLFGGTLRDSSTYKVLQYNDLWVYDPARGYWTWVSGSNNPNANATWGPVGQGTPYGAPSARHSAGMWIDSKNTIYLFGGGIGYSYTPISYNDFWTFTLGPAPPTAQAATTTTTSFTTTTAPAATTVTTSSSTSGRLTSTSTTGDTSTGGDSHNGGLTAGVVLVGVNMLLFDLAVVAAIVWYVMKRRAAQHGGGSGPAYAPVTLVDTNEDV